MDTKTDGARTGEEQQHSWPERWRDTTVLLFVEGDEGGGGGGLNLAVQRARRWWERGEVGEISRLCVIFCNRNSTK